MIEIMKYKPIASYRKIFSTRDSFFLILKRHSFLPSFETVPTKSTEFINNNNNLNTNSSSRLSNTFKLFSLSRFCKCPSPQRQKLYSKQQFASSTSEIHKIGICGKNNFENFDKPFFTGKPQKSQSLFDLTSNRQIEQEELPKESVRTIRAEMGAIEAEACGMLGRLQFHVQAIIGFARICTGDVFEVCIRHGHQRWRTRGKTQPDRSQRWDLQPPIASIQVLWNVPVQVRVLEIGFLRARCLSERQFDPAKFAAAQPQLVTMNLNSSGSLKLRLIVTWLPLLSSNIPSQFNNILNQKQLQAKENGFNNNNNHASLSQQNSLAQRPEPPERSAINNKLRQHQSQVLLSSVNNNNQKTQQNGVSIWRTTSSNSPSAFPSQAGNNNKTAGQNNNNTNNQANSTNNTNEQINGGKLNDVHQPSEHSPSSITTNGTIDNGPATKVCLRDKKRQREQRLKLGASVGAALGGGGGGGISRESSKTEKDRWRCSSTTLLDEVYKDLSKSIPTIDDVNISLKIQKNFEFFEMSLCPHFLLRVEPYF
uniref:FAM65 N-terminal domain-containing protein n=1 Tax=Meloidogyne incognita TaxID=6306 RepID=A0A914L7Z2_MELIC